MIQFCTILSFLILAGKIIAAEPYVPSAASSSSLSDRLAAMGGSIPGGSAAGADPRARVNNNSQSPSAGSYSPAEHLNREKSGTQVMTCRPYLSCIVCCYDLISWW